VNRASTLVVLPAILVLGLAGCDREDTTGSDPSAVDAAADGDAAAPPDGPPTSDGVASAPETHLQGQVDIDAEQTHASGVVFRLVAIEADGDGVYADVEVFNGSPRDVFIAREPPVLLVEGGPQLSFRPVEDNPQLELPSGSQLTARFGFLGRLTDPDARLELQINHYAGQPIDPRPDGATSIPHFRFEDLPVPGA
jgi:hypothetical protein